MMLRKSPMRLEPLKRYALPAIILGLIFSSFCRSLPATAGDPTPGSKTAGAASPAGDLNAPADDLQAVLAEMDKTAPSFKSAQADFEWVQYTKAVDEKDTQTGKVFIRRSSKDVDFALHFLSPHKKQAVVKDGKIMYHDPQTKQTTGKDISNNRDDVEAYMSLGFGSRGQDLLKYYDVTMTGWEMVDDVKTARLELVGKSDRLKKFFSKAILWIEPARA